MGLLNKKKRIIDTYLTPYGRKKLSEGNLGINFLAVTDKSSLYLKEENSIRDEEFVEICHESSTNFEDQIFFDSNSIVDFLHGKNEPIVTYYDGTYRVDSNNERVYDTISDIFESGANFVSTAESIITGSINRIKNKNYLKNKTENEFNSFEIDKDQVNFYVSRNSPIRDSALKEIDISATEPFFFDKYLSSTDNFKFLPPVLPVGENTEEKRQLGNYTDLNQKDLKTFSDIQESLKESPVREINFTKRSRDNNVVLQAFQIDKSLNNSRVIKLDTVNFGEFYEDGSFKKVVFAGKVFINSGVSKEGNMYRYPTYLNIFTIILEE